MLRMSVLSFYFLLLLVSGGICASWKHVNADNFRTSVKENDLTLVAFVMPWTEASKALQPEWVSTASKSKEKLITIDCTVEASLCKEQDVVSYPAIRLYRSDGRMSRYRGPKRASALLPFLRRSNQLPVSTLDKTNISAFKTTDDIVFIAYLAAMDEQLKKSFTSVAKRNRHRFSFGISTDPALAMAENIALGCIVYYNNMHKEQEMLCGENGIADLERWAEKVTMPLIGEMTRRNELRYLNSGKSLIYIFAFTENERKKYREELRPLAKKYEEYLSFVTIDAGEYAHMAPSLGLEEGVFPALAVMNSLMGQVFPFPNGREIEAKTVEAFVLDIVSGKTQPHTPSQSIVHDEM